MINWKFLHSIAQPHSTPLLKHNKNLVLVKSLLVNPACCGSGGVCGDDDVKNWKPDFGNYSQLDLAMSLNSPPPLCFLAPLILCMSAKQTTPRRKAPSRSKAPRKINHNHNHRTRSPLCHRRALNGSSLSIIIRKICNNYMSSSCAILLLNDLLDQVARAIASTLIVDEEEWIHIHQTLIADGCDDVGIANGWMEGTWLDSQPPGWTHKSLPLLGMCWIWLLLWRQEMICKSSDPRKVNKIRRKWNWHSERTAIINRVNAVASNPFPCNCFRNHNYMVVVVAVRRAHRRGGWVNRKSFA